MVTKTYVQATFVLGTFVHISNISISKLNTFDFSLVVLKLKLGRLNEQNLVQLKVKLNMSNETHPSQIQTLRIISFISA